MILLPCFVPGTKIVVTWFELFHCCLEREKSVGSSREMGVGVGGGVESMCERGGTGGQREIVRKGGVCACVCVCVRACVF